MDTADSLSNYRDVKFVKGEKMDKIRLLIDRKRADELTAEFSLNIKEIEPNVFVISRAEYENFRADYPWVYAGKTEPLQPYDKDEECADPMDTDQSMKRNWLTTAMIFQAFGIDDKQIRELHALYPKDFPIREIAPGNFRADHDELKRWVSAHPGVLHVSGLHFRSGGKAI